MNGEFRIGGWRVERDLNKISRDEKSVQLEPKVMDVLIFLALHPGEVQSRQEILRALWPDTFVSDEVLTYCISELRHALEDDAKKPQIIQTIPRRGYRLIAPVVSLEQREPPHSPPLPPMQPVPHKARWLYLASFTAVAILAVVLVWYHPWSSALEPTDFILLTDFVNTTGDPVFDGTLKHALAIHLGQSPFLNIFPEERARETLPYMERRQDEPLTREIGREICVRRGIRAMLVGSIASFGRIYVISLEVLNGQSGDVIAREQLEVASKEEIVRSLGTVATGLRRRLGESMKSVEKFDVPLEQATTASLEAFKAYSTGRRYLISGRMAEALPYYRRAIELDPKFASAYDDLAWGHEALAQRDLAAESAARAYELRDRVSEYERLSITSIYYTMTTGEVYKAIETLEVMKAIYPRSAPVHNTLGSRYLAIGEFEKAMECFREAIRLTCHPNAYGGLASTYLRLNRLQEAKDVIAEARSRGIDNRDLRSMLYTIAFVQGNPAAMIEQVRWASGKPDEVFMLGQQANAAAVSGQMGQARDFFRQAIEAARRHGLKNAGAELTAQAGLWEAFLGNNREAYQQAEEALAANRGWRILVRAAIILARCGRVDEAEALAEEIGRQAATATLIQTVSLPVVRGFIELARDNPNQALQAVSPHSDKSPRLSPWPAYIAGEAYLRLGSTSEARAQFQKILDNKGFDVFSPSQPLARIGIARALPASGDKGRKAYQDFFAFWINADQDIPLFRRALTEYASLK